jgi:hypothetical protein
MERDPSAFTVRIFCYTASVMLQSSRNSGKVESQAGQPMVETMNHWRSLIILDTIKILEKIARIKSVETLIG